MEKQPNKEDKDALPSNLPKLSQRNLQPIATNYEISIFEGEPLDTSLIVEQLAKLQKAFPALHEGFYEILIDRLKELNFSNRKLEAAINHVITTCPYPTIQPAQILSYDVKYKLYSYNEMISLIGEHKATIDDFAIIKIKGKTFRVLKVDKVQFNIPDEI